MRFRRILIVAALFGFSATSASAQLGPQEYLQFAGTHSGSTGPYYADVMNVSNGIWSPTGQRLTIFCVDFHHAVYGNSQWMVNVTSLAGGNLGNTRLGSWNGSGAPNTYLSGYSTLQRYTGAAYLAWMMEQSQPTNWAAIHRALWRVTTQNSNTYTAGDNAYYQQALQVMNGTLNPTGFNVNEWAILTDVAGVGDHGGIQEYATRISVPEPATGALMASGLLLLIGVGRSRKDPPGAA